MLQVIALLVCGTVRRSLSCSAGSRWLRAAAAVGLATAAQAEPQAPRLLSLQRLSPAVLAAGQVIEYSYEIDPRGNEADLIVLRLEEPLGDVFFVTASGSQTNGTLSVRTPVDMPGAIYHAVHVELFTLEGRTTRYHRNGSVTTTPTTLPAPPPLTSSLAVADVTLTNAPLRASAVLRSIRRTSNDTIGLGETIRFEVEVEKPGPDPVSIKLTLANADGTIVTLSGTGPGPVVPVTGIVELYHRPVPHQLRGVAITYRRVTATYEANALSYLPGGLLSFIPAGFAPSMPHDWDFRAFTFSITGTSGPVAPTIASLRRTTPESVLPGESVSFELQYEVGPDDIKDVLLIFEDAQGARIALTPEWPWNTATRPTTPGMVGNSYQLKNVIINGPGGGFAMYGPTGSATVTVPQQMSPPRLDFPAVSFTVSGATPPAIKTQPVSKTIAAGASIDFTVEATGSGLAYQWRKDGAPIPGATAATLHLPHVTPADAGLYTVEVSTAGGTVVSAAATLVVTAPTSPPVIVRQPSDQTVGAGASATFSVEAVNPTTITYQWRRDGIAIEGAQDNTLHLPAVQASDAGDYTVVLTSSSGSITSDVARLTVQPARSRLINLSVRANVSAGQVLILGLSARGEPVQVIARAAGPALREFNLPTALNDPRLTAYHGQKMVAENDNWNVSLAPWFESVGAFPFASDSRDAALRHTIQGEATYHISGDSNGIVLGETYALASGSEGRLINASARHRVGTGPDVLIGGFVVSGSAPLTVLVRALGPALSAFGVSNPLQDPRLDLYREQERLAGNDDWEATHATTFARTGAFALASNSKDAALVITLQPGVYTAIITGVDGSTGEALLELYEVPGT